MTKLLLISAHTTEALDELAVAQATALSAEPPEWVQLLPAGSFTGVDGRGPFEVKDPAEVIRLTREMTGGRDLPIDYGHALEQAGPEGDAAPAAGWITELDVRDGEIWGQVAWTEEGARRVRGREYRYLSPVFTHPKSGAKTVAWILRAGLTNRPNLVMKAVNSLSHQEDGMKELLQRIAAALGLSADADETTVLAKCTALSSASSDLVKVAQSVQLDDKATGDDIVVAVQKATTPDPKKFVPIEQYDTVSSALKAAQGKEGEGIVDQAIKDGRLIPAQRAWALVYHAQDAKGFGEFIAKQPVVLKPGAEERRDVDGKVQLDADQKAVCAALMIDESKFVANLKKE